MSYCRFGEDSDVYAYDDVSGGVQIWTVGGSHDLHCATPCEAYFHILELRDRHGLKVPEYALEALRGEAGSAISRAEAVERLMTCDCHTALDFICVLLPDLKARSPRRVRDGLIELLSDDPTGNEVSDA